MDKFLMRLKDWLLIIGTVAGLTAGGLKLYGARFEDRLSATEKTLDKYIPIIEDTKMKAALSDQKLDQILSRLGRMEGKLDRR